jgi:hypothetical protein
MKRIAFVISLLSLSCTMALAQQDYFVFIQSDKQQPFYVRFHEKTHSSSAIGHLVLSRLSDSTYHFVIGFPKNLYPERDFTIPIAHKDHAYQLKWMGEQGWVLFNEQTLDITKPLQDPATGNSLGLGERKTGEFATLMASLVNDSSVMYKTLVKADLPKPAAVEAKVDTAIVMKDIPKKDETAMVTDTAKGIPETGMVKLDSLKKDTAIIIAQAAPTPDAAAPVIMDSAVVRPPDTQAVAKAAMVPEAKASIIQLHERSGDSSKEWVFVDSSAAGIDTIPVLIALDKKPVMDSAISITSAADSARNARLLDSVVAINEKAPLNDNNIVADTKKVVDSVKTAPVKTAPVPKDSTTTPAAAAPKPALALFNSDCTNFATEQDVDKLRVKMLAVNSTDDKIGAAKKVFKTKCFVTRYIKALSELFPNDESRFKFFEAAYPFVSDTSSFRGLVDLLSSELYVARFKAMVRM